MSGDAARIALLPARTASQFPVLYFGGVLKMGYLCYSFRGFTGTMGLNFAETRSYERLQVVLTVPGFIISAGQ